MDRKNEIFAGALRLEKPARRGYLDQACGGDDALRDEIEELLRSHEQAAEFLDSPAIESGLPAEAPGDLPPGARIGGFRIIERLGAGGMGSVYLAERDTDSFEQRVAIKLIRIGLERPDVRLRFRNERRILAALEHPHIARLIDGGETDDGRPYLVMEHVAGVPIDRYCRERALDTGAVLDLFLAVCDAVEHAHRHLVVHRDLKPSNILVTAEGQVKLLDFGISKVLESDTGPSDLTQTGLRALTPRYASPEQIRAAPVTTASDVYGLGVVLYELLTGSHPFAAADTTPGELERSICETDPQKPSERVREASGDSAAEVRTRPRELAGDLDTIVLMALRKEPERRYASVADLARDIRCYLTGRPVAARRPTLRYRVEKLARRNPAAVAATLAAVLLLIAGAAISSLLAVRAARHSEEATRQAEIAGEINRFLNEDLLAQADPNNEVDRDIRLREVVERAEENLGDRFVGKPRVEAAIRGTLGKTLENLGEYDAALGHYQQAIELLEPLVDEGSARGELNQSRADLGGLYYSLGRYEEALATLEPIGHAQLAADDPLALRVSHTVGVLYDALGRDEEAIPAMEASVRLHREVLGPEHVETLTAINNLALMYQELDRFDEAGVLLDEILAVRKKNLGNHHPDTIVSLMSVGYHENLVGDLERAEEVIREAVELGGSVLGQDHPWQLNNLYLLGVVLRNAERLDEALAVTSDALTRQRDALGESHTWTLQTQTTLATIYHDLGRYEEAIELNTPVVAERLATLGNTHLLTIVALWAQAASERVTGRCDAVVERTAPLLAELREAHPEGHRIFGRLLGEYGACLVESGRVEEGIAVLEEAHARLVTAMGEDHELTREARAALVALREGS